MHAGRDGMNSMADFPCKCPENDFFVVFLLLKLVFSGLWCIVYFVNLLHGGVPVSTGRAERQLHTEDDRWPR